MKVQLNLDYDSLEVTRLELYKKIKVMRLPGIISLIAGFILSIIFSFKLNIPLIVISIILIILGFILLFIAMFRSNKASSLLKKRIFLDVLKQMYGDDVSYAPMEKLDANEMVKTGQYRKPDAIIGQDLIIGSYKGVSFKTSDMTLQEVHTDSDGNTTTTTYFKGRYIIYYLKRNFNHTLSIIERKFLNSLFSNKTPSGQKLVKVETESIAFNKKFDVRSDDKIFAFYIINPAFMEDIIAIEAMTKGNITCYLRGNEFHLGLETKEETIKFKVSKPLTKDYVESLFGGLALMAELIDNIRLDMPKFNSPNGGI